MAELANCPNCGQVFVRSIRAICPSCYKKEEEMFQTVYSFLSRKEHRRATMMEICEATKVAEKTITRFIREGRLRTVDFPNLYFPCDSCGMPIHEGTLCAECRDGLRESLESFDREQQFEQRKKESLKPRTYFSDKSRN